METVRRICRRSYVNPGLARWVHKEAQKIVRPVNITLHRAPPPSPSYKGLELEYEDGGKFYFPAEFLRVRSPSADSLRTTASGQTRVISGRRHVQILDIEAVGNYGIRIKYDDTHDTGIYTWDYMDDLGSKKFYYMRMYMKALQDQGLSRNPMKRK